VIKPDRWLSDFETLDIKPEVRPLILKENAVKLLGLSATKASTANERPALPCTRRHDAVRHRRGQGSPRRGRA
jgi:hypothetical protein